MTPITKIFKNYLLNNKAKKITDLRKHKMGLSEKTQRKLISGIFSKASKVQGHFQVLDFFSGSGGMTSGFYTISKLIPGSFEVLGGIDINQDALSTFTKNFSKPGVVADIRRLTNKKELDAVLKKVNYDSKKPLILIGCAPCQGFTSHRKKNWDEKDPRNNLISSFVKIAIQLSPECIVMENVPEMFSSKYKNYYQSAKSALEDAGYVVHQKIFNTATFGVPQERFRLLSVAMKKDFLLPTEILKREEFLTVRDAIGDLPAVDPGVPYLRDAYHVSAKHKPSTVEVMKLVPKNGGNRPIGIGPKCLDKVKGFSDVYGRLSWDKPSITITQYARNPASGRYVHPEQNRGLTIREVARIQGFPDDFIFLGGFDSTFKQVGEAVPPKFSCGVAASVFVELLSESPTLKEKMEQDLYTLKPVSNSYSSVIAGVKNSINTK